MVFDSFKNYLIELGLLDYNDKISFKNTSNKIIALKNYLNKALINDEHYLENICKRIYNTYILKNLATKLQSLEMMIETINNKTIKCRKNTFDRIKKYKFKFDPNKKGGLKKVKSTCVFKFTKNKIKKETNRNITEIEENFPSLRNIVDQKTCISEFYKNNVNSQHLPSNINSPSSIKNVSFIKLNSENENQNSTKTSYIPITFRSRQKILTSNSLKRSYTNLINSNSIMDKECTFKPNLYNNRVNKYDGYEFQTINNLDCLDEKSYNESNIALNINLKKSHKNKNDYLNVILNEHIIKYK